MNARLAEKNILCLEACKSHMDIFLTRVQLLSFIFVYLIITPIY